MNKIKTVISILADILDIRKKDISLDTAIFLFHGKTEIQNSSLVLSNADTTKFLRKIEKKYGIYFPANSAKDIMSVKNAAEHINDKVKIEKEKQKAEKDKIGNFIYSVNNVEVLRITQGTTISLLGNPAELQPDFWLVFDKWYKANSKKIRKSIPPIKVKVKKQKKPIKDDAPVANAA